MKIRKIFFRFFPAAISLAAAAALCACGDPGPGIVQTRMGSGKQKAQEGQEAVASTEERETDAEKEDLYILAGIDPLQKTATFAHAKNGRQSQYAYDTGTQFLDKYGDTRSAASFLAGDAVTVEVDHQTQQLVRVRLSDEVWIQDDLENYSFDPDIHAFIIGRTRYAYDPDMQIFSGDRKISVESLSDSDALRVVGLDKKILSVSVVRGHGYLALANTKLFEGSFICVGDKIFKEVTKNMKIEVPEGRHVVTVANNGYGDSKEVEIERDKTISLNLDELKGEGPKLCKITFDVGVEGAALFIDGKKADYSAPVELAYGVHTIAVEAEGYDAIKKKLVVNSAEAEIEIALTESAKAEPDEQGTGSQNGQGDGGNSNQSNNNGGSGNGSNNNGNSNGGSGNGNNNNGNNNGNNGNNNGNNDSSQNDYLTTLYNLLTSINNKNGKSESSGGSSGSGGGSDSGRSYDDLRDE